ncbi:hydroxymethylglutaryl-CoA reductase [Pseudobacteriovorax antillogorgiicola]|uniref:hydroxymethylglutaryl-CoA reductase n=1 Tax=Pseudobacteriovorax antillogorgiicola TaxID=1513793 RepID=UPI001404E796|nr:hydroxymethylglutaryl-CoA reductase [Pseudobacteriovorax antillogorgiicola]
MNSSLDHIRDTHLCAEKTRGNIENFLGAVQIPVGLAGPLLFQGEWAQGSIFAPFATTEGALVASASRGAKALSESGGVHTRVLSQNMYRAPSFVCKSFLEAKKLGDFLVDHIEALQDQVSKVTRYGKILNIEPHYNGRTLHALIRYSTGNAAGQNMVTIASAQLGKWVMEEAPRQLGIEIAEFHIEGGLNGDKKVNFLNFISGRGCRVVAEVELPNIVVEQVLKTNADDLAHHYQRGAATCLMNGGVGVNVNIANAIAAIFIATGQDAASVHESSLGHLNFERTKDGLYASLMLPSLAIGTVGGGTRLPGQSEALSIMGCQGQDVRRLAEIIAGYCLGLDLSTWSAIASHSFVQAHQTLGRR